MDRSTHDVRRTSWFKTIRKRFGTDAVMRVTFLDQPIDHMSGGISREKRSADYDRVMIQ